MFYITCKSWMVIHNNWLIEILFFHYKYPKNIPDRKVFNNEQFLIIILSQSVGVDTKLLMAICLFVLTSFIYIKLCAPRKKKSAYFWAFF